MAASCTAGWRASWPPVWHLVGARFRVRVRDAVRVRVRARDAVRVRARARQVSVEIHLAHPPLGWPPSQPG
eukprot:scaffold54952_cov31-Phaeocystis_antarctica.AAC.1